MNKISRSIRNLASFAIIGSLLMLGATRVSAASGGDAPAGASQAGAGPDAALAPNGGWMPLAVGQRVWYAFQYAGDSSPILIDMAVSPSNGATFSVWTPADLASWAGGNGESSVGQSSSDSYVNGGDQVWQGEFNLPGTYYVVVDQARSAAAGILLSVIGSGVGIETASAHSPAAQVAGSAPKLQDISFAPATRAPSPPSPGAGPDTALAPNGRWMPLAVGQRAWYAFQYAGDSSPILIDMAVSPSNGAAFSVWTPADLASWAAGNGESSVGQSSSDSYVNGGDQVWQGEFNLPGTYYVIVDQARSTAAGILLSVIGNGVAIETARLRAQAGGR